jgi:hypothetical protein
MDNLYELIDFTEENMTQYNVDKFLHLLQQWMNEHNSIYEKHSCHRLLNLICQTTININNFINFCLEKDDGHFYHIDYLTLYDIFCKYSKVNDEQVKQIICKENFDYYNCKNIKKYLTQDFFNNYCFNIINDTTQIILQQYCNLHIKNNYFLTKEKILEIYNYKNGLYIFVLLEYWQLSIEDNLDTLDIPQYWYNLYDKFDFKDIYLICKKYKINLTSDYIYNVFSTPYISQTMYDIFITKIIEEVDFDFTTLLEKCCINNGNILIFKYLFDMKIKPSIQQVHNYLAINKNKDITDILELFLLYGYKFTKDDFKFLIENNIKYKNVKVFYKYIDEELQTIMMANHNKFYIDLYKDQLKTFIFYN